MQSIRYPGFVFLHKNIICHRHRSGLRGPAPSAEHTNPETLGAHVESRHGQHMLCGTWVPDGRTWVSVKCGAGGAPAREEKPHGGR